MNNVKTILFCSLVGVALLVSHSRTPGAWRDFLLFGGVVLVCVGIAVFGMDVFETTLRAIRMNDRKTAQMEIISRMTVEQIAYARDSLGVGLDIATDGRTYLHGTSVPMEFVVDEFLARSNDRHAVPVRVFSEGTEREYAQQVTRVMIDAGFAEPAAGNMSARWKAGVTPRVVARKLGRELRSISELGGGWKEIPG